MGAAKLLDKEISHYVEHLNTHQKKVVLGLVKTLAQEEADWWEQVETAAEQSIKKGLKDAKEGRITPHDEVMKKYRKWLSK